MGRPFSLTKTERSFSTILFPSQRILINILLDYQELLFIPDDPVVEISLPDWLSRRSSKVVDSFYHPGFILTNDCP